VESDVTMTVTDPDSVITALIIGVEPGLDADIVAGVLAAVAPGRNVRRRLAQALAERPGVSPTAVPQRPGSPGAC
jgi:hypothetical protein